MLPGFVSGGDHLVGAGLPAKTVCQAREMLDVPASSLASQLLQVYWVLPGFVSGGDHLVGAGLPAKAVCQAREMLAVPASSLASQLHRFIGCCRDLCLGVIPCSLPHKFAID